MCVMGSRLAEAARRRFRVPLLTAGEPRGSLILEVLMAVVVFAVVGTAVLSGVSIAQISGSKLETQSTAENLARNQMESVFTQPYQPAPYTYTSVQLPPGYAAGAQAEEFVTGDGDIQRVIVTVSLDGQDILILETLRARE